MPSHQTGGRVVTAQRTCLHCQAVKLTMVSFHFGIFRPNSLRRRKRASLTLGALVPSRFFPLAAVPFRRTHPFTFPHARRSGRPLLVRRGHPLLHRPSWSTVSCLKVSRHPLSCLFRSLSCPVGAAGWMTGGGCKELRVQTLMSTPISEGVFLSTKSCADTFDPGIHARQKCFLEAYRVARRIAVSMFVISRKKRSRTRWTTNRRAIRRVDSCFTGGEAEATRGRGSITPGQDGRGGSWCMTFLGGLRVIVGPSFHVQKDVARGSPRRSSKTDNDFCSESPGEEL